MSDPPRVVGGAVFIEVLLSLAVLSVVSVPCYCCHAAAQLRQSTDSARVRFCNVCACRVLHVLLEGRFGMKSFALPSVDSLAGCWYP